MPWPVTINGTTYTEADFAPFRYSDTFPRFAADLEAVARQAEAAQAQAATLAAALASQRYGTVLITAATALSMAAHGNRLLQVSGSATLSLSWNDTGGGFSCLIANQRAVALPLSLSGFTLSNPDGHTRIRASGMAALVVTEGSPGVVQLVGQTE